MTFLYYQKTVQSKYAAKRAFLHNFFAHKTLAQVCEIYFLCFEIHKQCFKTQQKTHILKQIHNIKEKVCEVYLKVFTRERK